MFVTIQFEKIVNLDHFSTIRIEWNSPDDEGKYHKIIAKNDSTTNGIGNDYPIFEEKQECLAQIRADKDETGNITRGAFRAIYVAISEGEHTFDLELYLNNRSAF